jgi:hypothetical protein
MRQAPTTKVLMIGDNSGAFALPLRRLEQRGCECRVASSREDLEALLGQGPFDLVLSTRTLRGRSTSGLSGLLCREGSSLFYALGADPDSWWLPVLKRGRGCFGAPALRANEFMAALDDVVAGSCDHTGPQQAGRKTLQKKARIHPC